MAQKVVRYLLCDLHDDEVDGQETVPFALDGTAYEIDACTSHTKELRDALGPFVKSARAAQPTRPRRRAAAVGKPAKAVSTGDVRAWAKANGRAVSDRGRIPQSIVDEYEATHA